MQMVEFEMLVSETLLHYRNTLLPKLCSKVPRFQNDPALPVYSNYSGLAYS